MSRQIANSLSLAHNAAGDPQPAHRAAVAYVKREMPVRRLSRESFDAMDPWLQRTVVERAQQVACHVAQRAALAARKAADAALAAAQSALDTQSPWRTPLPPNTPLGLAAVRGLPPDGHF